MRVEQLTRCPENYRRERRGRRENDELSDLRVLRGEIIIARGAEPGMKNCLETPWRKRSFALFSEDRMSRLCREARVGYDITSACQANPLTRSVTIARLLESSAEASLGHEFLARARAAPGHGELAMIKQRLDQTIVYYVMCRSQTWRKW